MWWRTLLIPSRLAPRPQKDYERAFIILFQELSLGWWGAICTWKQSSAWVSLVQQAGLQSDGNVSLVWINGKLHLQVYQIVFPGSELLLCPQLPSKNLSVMRPRLEEEAAAVVVAEEESARQEEVAFPRQDAAESWAGVCSIHPCSRSFGLQGTLSQNRRQGLDTARLGKSSYTIMRAKLGVPASVEKLIVGPRELAQRVRVLATVATLPKVLGSMPRTHLAVHNFV